MRRGLALILVVGVLGVLAVLGSAFAVLSRLERRAAVQRVLGTQAMLLARSGMEDALARIGMGMDPTSRGNAYRGEDWNDDGLVSGLETAAEAYQPGSANLLDCPTRHAMAPSFFKRHATDLDANGRPAPERVRADGRERGYSGRLSQGTWSLKVEDESAKINVNGGFLDGRDRDNDGILDFHDPAVRLTTALSDTGLGWNAQLVRILNVLGNQTELGVVNLGTLSVQNRPKGGYASIPALQASLGITKDLSPFLTVSSWADRKVIHPNAFQGMSGQPGQNGLSDIKKARGPLSLEEGGRPPVNLNAAPRPVLVALLSGLKGKTFALPTVPASCTVSPALASAIADRILAQRASSPFTTWSRFQAFVDTLVDGGTITPGLRLFNTGAALALADLVKAALNPNTQSAKEMPDQLRWLWVDKTDLSTWSTEGSLGPTGSFRIQSVGRTLGRNGRVLSVTGRSITAEVFRPFRQTTQADFVGGRTSLKEYLSLSSAPDLTTGVSVPPVSAAAWWGPAPPSVGSGLTVTTYPAPPPAVTAGKAAAFDGYLALAGVELSGANPDGGTLRFLHHFDDSWNADAGAAGSVLARQSPGQDDSRLQADVTESVWPAPLVEPNTLLPDGFHAQVTRSPSFLARLNFPIDDGISNRAVVSYWVKRLALSISVNLSPITFYEFDFSCVRRNASGFTQAFQIGQVFDEFGVCMENRADPFDDGDMIITFERRKSAQYRNRLETLQPGMRWHLVTALIDTDEPAGNDVRLFVRGVDGAPPDPLILGYENNFETSGGQDLFEAGLLFTLGRPLGSADLFSGLAKRVNHVLDEFAIYDFGDAVNPALDKLATWMDQRYVDGRYYKLDDAAFLSAPLAPDSGRPVRLLSASWTALLPGEDRREIVASANGELEGTSLSRLPDPALSASRIEVELVDPATTGVRNGGTLLTLGQGSAIGLTMPGFRYRVRFQPRLADPLNQPVLETPIFDDITFACAPVGGPRMLTWE